MKIVLAFLGFTLLQNEYFETLKEILFFKKKILIRGWEGEWAIGVGVGLCFHESILKCVCENIMW